MKITGSNLFKASFAGLDSARGGIGKKAEDADKAKENPNSKRIEDIQDALRQLEVGMNPKQAAKKASAQKIGMLQRRLMELKQMLLYATPEQAKALARELKSIAGELASAAKAAGGASGGSQAASAVAPVVTGADAASALGKAEVVKSAETQAAEGAATAAKEADDAAALRGSDAAADQPHQVAQKDASLSGEKRSDESRGSIEISDNVLKDMLREARRLLNEAIGMAKLKMGRGDKEARKDLEDAEKKLREIGLNTETQVTSASLYTSQGIGTPDIGGAAGLASAGTNISTEA